MSNVNGPLYEAHFVIEDEVLAEVDSWLANVVLRALSADGVIDARVFGSGSDEQGRGVRTCQIQTRDDAAFDEHVDGFFAEIDAEAAHQFAEHVVIQSRVLRADDEHELPSNENPLCLNCGTRLRGQYCGSCGQRSRNRLISIWQLLREAFGDLLELDSRLWKTLIPLLTRPGQLTKDYLEGRRARYMPPFRTYLVLSVVFFVVAFFNPKAEFDVLFDDAPVATAEEIDKQEKEAGIVADENQAQLDEALEKLKELEAEGKIDKSVVDQFADNSDNGLTINLGEDDEDEFIGDCEDVNISDDEDFPDWLKKRFTDETVKKLCEANKVRGADSFKDAMIDNIPIALIVLLPLMAMVLKVLYPLSRRYFVEHILFFIHFHAFFFAILIVLLLFNSLVAALSLDGTISTLVIVATSLYVPVYLYKAMRRVYAQGHLITIPKYLLLLVAYLTGATFTLLGVFLIVVFSA